MLSAIWSENSPSAWGRVRTLPLLRYSDIHIRADCCLIHIGKEANNIDEQPLKKPNDVKCLKRRHFLLLRNCYFENSSIGRSNLNNSCFSSVEIIDDGIINQKNPEIQKTFGEIIFNFK